MASSGFVELDHTADWAIRVRGADLADLFLQAAAGLLSLANPTPAPGHASSHVRLRLMAADRETLLVRWLEELHFLLETQHLIPRSIRLRVSPGLRLIADLLVGDAYSPGRSIKAVTFHGLHVSETAGGLEATVVFDV
jgi:SHS2 domain-containing protein